MRYCRGALWAWAAWAMLAWASAKFQESDYENTLMEDPLQPVWDRLEDLSGEIGSVKAMMKQYTEEVKRDIDEKFSSISLSMSQQESKNAVFTKMLTDQLDASSPHTVSSNLTNWLRNFYGEHMRADADEYVRKVEQHVDVKVMATENALKAHISEVLGSAIGNATIADSSSSSSSTSVVSSVASTAGLEARIVSRISRELSSLQSVLTEQVTGLSRNLTSKSDEDLTTVNDHFRKMIDLLKETGTGACTTLVEKVSELMASQPVVEAGQAECNGLSEETAKQLTSALGQMQRSTTFLGRDCSDLHWYQPEAPSGVYGTYPTMDPKAPVTAWCDMGSDGVMASGGWTVILRRRNTTWGLVNFNRTWSDYREGFGVPGEGEWWYGLASLHALTYRQPYEIQILMRDIEKGSFVANYFNFRVEDETKNYRLIVDGFSGNVSMDALSSKHHGSTFSTLDRDNDEWEGGSCAVSNGGGWWFNACHYTTLTAPFPTSNDRSAKTIRWVTEEEEGHWLVLDDVTVKIRPAGYGVRFQAQSA